MRKFNKLSLTAVAASAAFIGFTQSASAEVELETAFIFNTL